MTLRLIISIWATFATATLTAGVVLGQQLQPEVAPPAFPPPASTPFEVAPPPNFTPPPPSLLEDAPPEIALPLSRKDEPAASEVEGIAMGGPGMGGPGMGGPGYGATWYPTRPVSGSTPGEDFGLIQQNLSGGVPLWRDGGDALMLMAGVRNSMFFTDAILPDSHRPFPSDLWNVHLGTNYMHKFDNGWSGMLGINFGSASDKPFHSINEVNVGFMSFLQIPVRNDRDSWRLSLMYSPVGNFNFPIPMAAYLWNPSDAFHASIGFPPAVMWRPVEDLTISLSYMPLTTVNARATYRVVGKVFIYGGFESMQEAYLLADRENVGDRFMGFEKRLIGGLRWDVWRHAALDMNAGYAFNRYYGVGQNQIGNLHDQVNIAPGAFLSTNFNIRF
jgi:hypothetical protein